MSGKSDATARALRHWQEIDRRLNRGKLDADAVSREAIEGGLARRTIGPGPPDGLREIWTIEPARGPNLVPGPLLLVAFEDGMYGGPRLYRPVSDELRWDTGAFS